MASTLRQQADELALIGSERKHQLEMMRANPKRKAEADLREVRMPVLRDAYATLNKLAQGDNS